MRLFKYVDSPEAAVAMAGGSLKFTPVAELNDPMEVLPFFDEEDVRESLSRLRTDGCTDEQYQWLQHQQELLARFAPAMQAIRLPEDRQLVNALYRSAMYDHLPMLRAMLAETIRIIRSNVGILSLSERIISMPMWSHYAKDAAGFAVVLDGLATCFSGDGTGSLNVAKPVIYSERYLGMTFDPPTQDRLFFSKLSDWSYEKEWRIVRGLDECRRDERSGRRLYLQDIDPLHVRAIICGWSVPDEGYRELRNKVADVNPAAIVLRSSVELGHVKFDGELPEELRPS